MWIINIKQKSEIVLISAFFAFLWSRFIDDMRMAIAQHTHTLDDVRFKIESEKKLSKNVAIVRHDVIEIFNNENDTIMQVEC